MQGEGILKKKKNSQPFFAKKMKKFTQNLGAHLRYLWLTHTTEIL